MPRPGPWSTAQRGGGGTEKKLSKVNKNSSLGTWKCVGAGELFVGEVPLRIALDYKMDFISWGFFLRLMKSSPKLMSCVD